MPVGKRHIRRALSRFSFLLAVFLLLGGCVHQLPLPQEHRPALYTVGAGPEPGDGVPAPLFVVYGSGDDFNRIGKPSVRIGGHGEIDVFTDSRKPAVYYRAIPFSTRRGDYVNHVYRVHFAAVPFSLIPFHLTAGKNVGLLVIVTASPDGTPLLVTTVHTCGCYLAMVPTSYLPQAAWPPRYRAVATQRVFGENLPGLLDYRGKADARLLVHLRPGVHRVMGLKIEEASAAAGRYRWIPMQRLALEDLERIEVAGRTTSFYYTEGIREGFVKGALKPWETLTMSLLSLDFFVGTDKIYDPREPTTNRFYTSLVPWKQRASDMRDFAAFLKFWGWRL